MGVAAIGSVAMGVVAMGVAAMGVAAVGIVMGVAAIGSVAMGVVAMGVAAMGVAAVGIVMGVAAMGLAAMGIVMGVVAMGVVAMGVAAMGVAAVGIVMCVAAMGVASMGLAAMGIVALGIVMGVVAMGVVAVGVVAMGVAPVSPADEGVDGNLMLMYARWTNPQGMQVPMEIHTLNLKMYMGIISHINSGPWSLYGACGFHIGLRLYVRHEYQQPAPLTHWCRHVCRHVAWTKRQQYGILAERNTQWQQYGILHRERERNMTTPTTLAAKQSLLETLEVTTPTPSSRFSIGTCKEQKFKQYEIIIMWGSAYVHVMQHAELQLLR